MPSEEKWYALTGRVVDAKVEADGDIHLALEATTGNNVGTVSAEIPVGPKWWEIRQAVFGWTTQKFPFSVKTARGSVTCTGLVLEIRQSLYIAMRRGLCRDRYQSVVPFRFSILGLPRFDNA